MALRLKMAATVAAAIALVGAVAWLAVDRISSAVLSSASREAIRGAGAAFYDTMQASAEGMGALLGALARDRDLTAALRSHDHRRLLALAGPMYRDLEARHGITHWNYWEVEGAASDGAGLRNVIRLGTPTMRGDFVERATLARVSREKALVTGLELGYTGFVLRALAPVRDGGELLGYAEIGREIGPFLGEMKARTGDDYALVLDKRFIDPRRWASTRGARGERNDWQDREEVLLVRDTTRGSAIAEDVVSPGEIPDDGRVLSLLRDGPRVIARGVFAVRDASERKVGAVFVLRDVTTLSNDVDRLRRGAARLLAAVMIGAVSLVLAAFELLVIRPRIRAAREAAAASVSN